MWFGEYKSTLLEILHELEPFVLQSEIGTLATPKAHGKGLILKNFTQIMAYISCCVWLKPLGEHFLVPKNKLTS